MNSLILNKDIHRFLFKYQEQLFCITEMLQQRIIKLTNSRYIKQSNMRKQNSFQFNISNHEFIITPQRLIFNNQTTGQFQLELQKGCQRIKVLPEIAEFDNNKEYLYRNIEPITIKVFKQKNTGYSWSLYKKVENKMQFMETFKLDLNARYMNYIQQMKNLNFEFTSFIQIFESNLPISESWFGIKSQLRSYRIKEVLKNQENIAFECLIEIRSNFDHLSEQQVEKKKFLKKGSIQSQGNNSSRNSLKDKSKALSQEKKKSPTNKDRIQKQSIQPKSTASLQSQNCKNPENQTINKVTTFQHSQQQGIMIMPQLPIRQMTALSDIIQASMEQSSPNSGDKTDRKPSEQNLSPQQSNRNFKKTNTFHFGHNNAQKDEFRRNNSLKATKSGLKLDDSQEGNIQEMAAEQQQTKYQIDQLTNHSTIIKPQRTVKQTLNETTSNKKYVFSIILLFVVFISFSSLLTPLLKEKLQKSHRYLIKNKNKIKKGSLNWQTIHKNI